MYFLTNDADCSYVDDSPSRTLYEKKNSPQNFSFQVFTIQLSCFHCSTITYCLTLRKRLAYSNGEARTTIKTEVLFHHFSNVFSTSLTVVRQFQQRQNSTRLTKYIPTWGCLLLLRSSLLFQLTSFELFSSFQFFVKLYENGSSLSYSFNFQSFEANLSSDLS